MISDNVHRFIKLLHEQNSFLLAAHRNPDGDAIGSILCLAILLERMGKKVHCYSRDHVPPNLIFLPQSNRVTSKLPNKVDAGILVDCAQRKRSSDDILSYGGAKVWACIDHHHIEDKDSAVDPAVVDSEAAATGVMLYDIINEMGESIDADMATCLYCAIVIDTGFFRYPNTDAEIFHIAERLVRLGAVPWAVSKGIEESYPASRLKLMGESFSTLETKLGGRYASISVTKKMLKRAGATMDASDEFAVYPRTIAGVEVSALFRELDSGIKVSLRSKDAVDVSAIANGFGGGGHPRAAGCLLKVDDIDEARDIILKAVSEELGKIK